MSDFEFVTRPEKGWRPKRLRGNRGPFNQAQYDALKETLIPNPDGTRRAMRFFLPIEQAQGVNGGRGGGIIDTAVRIRLLDVEGYTLGTTRYDEESQAVWIEPEELICSITGRTLNCVDWQISTGVRMRRGNDSPYAENGILLAAKKSRRPRSTRDDSE